jgi:hypothetical protein
MIGAFAAAGVMVLHQHAISMSGWDTEFDIRDVALGEFVRLGDRDEVVPIDAPRFAAPDDVDWLTRTSPVIALEIDGEARAYPLAVLVYHQVVNDEFQGVPLAVTYCALCNSAIVYDRRVGGDVLRFGVSGAMRNSGFVMWDNLTQSWWQQFTGKAIMGSLTGTMLDILPSKVISLAVFEKHYPDGQVLVGDSALTGTDYNYGMSPMSGSGYEYQSDPPYYDGIVDSRLDAMERVLGAVIEGQPVVYPFTLLAQARVINDTVNGTAVVAFWQSGAVSPLDKSRDVGMAVLFYSTVDGQTLTFYAKNGVIKDAETHSVWTILGKAIDGKLKGTRLEQTDGTPNFWFAWAASYPETLVYEKP